MTTAHTGNNQPLRVGLIGTGKIGRMHAGLLATQVRGAVLACVADADPAAATAVGADMAVPAVSPDSLLADPSVGAVAICAATPAHVPLIVAAAEAGKAIFCEKPVSLDLAEVDRALAAVAGAGVPLMIGFNRRFDPSHAAVREAVATGRAGATDLVRITSRDPAPPPLSYAATSGGLFLDMTIHDFDMARFVVGSEVNEVFAWCAVKVEPDLAGLGDIDTAVVSLRHDNGCLTVIDNCRRASYGYDQRVEVLGSLGLAASENPLVTTSLWRGPAGTELAPLPDFYLDRYHTSYLRQWDAFVAAVTSGQAPPTTGDDGRAALVLGLAAKLSLAEARPVGVAEVSVA